MSVESVKTAILDQVKQEEICPDYQSFLIASSEDELIAAGYEHVEWAYSLGMIDGTLLEGLDQTILNENGYYTSSSHTLNNPGGDVFVFGNAVMTINLTLNNRCRVVICSDTATVNINASGNSFVKIKRIKNLTPVVIVLSDNAAAMCDFEGDGNIDVTANDNSVFHSTIKGGATFNYSANDTSTAVIKSYHNSQININPGAGSVTTKSHDQSIVNNEPIT